MKKVSAMFLMRAQEKENPSAGTAALGGILLFCLLGGFLITQLVAAPPPRIEIAGFATSLKGRTVSQRHNARLAARALDGAVILPGEVFSFNRRVRSWSMDQGYVKAPVSYDGELVRAFGGGVCQTSTTLYNAVLLAGLPILERHPHVFAPRYIPPGRDAAVAYPGVDLRFRNAFPWPITVRARAQGERLEVRLYGRERPQTGVEVASNVLETIRPLRLTRVLRRPDATGRAYVRSPGATGYRVVTYRLFTEAGRQLRRERLSDDTYRAMNHVVQLDEEEAPALP